MKVCNKCRRHKELDDFNWRSLQKQEKEAVCRECKKLHRLSKVDERKEQMLGYRGLLTLAQYDEIYRAQGGRCKVCRTPGLSRSDQGRRSLAVDHCHVTGKFRGLLCIPCNTLLGKMEKDLVRVGRLLEYAQLSIPDTQGAER